MQAVVNHVKYVPVRLNVYHVRIIIFCILENVINVILIVKSLLIIAGALLVVQDIISTIFNALFAIQIAKLAKIKPIIVQIAKQINI